LLLVLAVGTSLGTTRADEPGQKPLTEEQRALLKERDQYAAEAEKLLRAQEPRKAIDALDKKLAVERRLYGPAHAEIAQTLERLAGLREEVEEFAAARKAREELVAMRTTLHGEKDWRVTDARLALEDLGLRTRLDADGRRRWRQADEVAGRAGLLSQSGRGAEALAAAQQALEIRRDLLGENHHAYATSLVAMVALHYRAGDYASALPLAKRAVALRKKLLTEKHPDYAVSLNDLALIYQATGNLVGAQSLFEQACDIKKETLGESNLSYATSLGNLAGVYHALGKDAKALPLYERARDIKKRLLTENHPGYALSLNNLAIIHHAQGDYAKALALMEEAHAIFKKLLTERHPYFALSLTNLGGMYREAGDYPRALALVEQAREIRGRIVGKEHPDYGASLNNLADLYMAMGQYDKAQPLLEQALDVIRRARTEEHPEYAQTLTNLAVLHWKKGDVGKALQLSERARDLREKALGQSHPAYAESLNTLATLYRDLGDYTRALSLQEKVRNIYKEVLPEDHPSFIICLHNLALLHEDRGDYDTALPLLEQARMSCKRVFTEEHPQYAQCLNALAVLYEGKGDYDRAQSLFEQARGLNEKLVTKDHPEYALNLHNLAWVHQCRGEYAKAVALYEEARTIEKTLLTEKHPHYAHSLQHLAYAYHQLGRPADAAPLWREGLALQRAALDRSFTSQNDRQRLELLGDWSPCWESYMSCVTAEVPAPAAEAYEQVLAWKGALAARRAEEQAAQDRPELRELVGQLRLARAGLARLAQITPATPEQRDDWLKRFDDLEGRKEKLERQLAEKSEVFRRFRDLQKAGPVEVAKALPAETALVDFLVYKHLTPTPKARQPYRQEARLLAFVVVRGREPVCVPLGPAEVIDQAVQAWRRAATNGQSLDASGAELARRVWQPLEKHIAGAKAILLAPDGPVCALPFAALPGRQQGTYLLEERALGYVTSGRHLLELAADEDRPRSDGLLAVGGLDYGPRPDGFKAVAAADGPRGLQLRGDTNPQLFLQAAYWKPLPGSQREAEQIAQAYRKRGAGGREPVVLTGRDADAPRIERELTPREETPRWRYLHLATHGYFRPPVPEDLRPRNDARRFDPQREQRVWLRNPLLASGLVLAGANHTPDKGTLSGLEVTDLDLRGCELVVLSACDTGLGKVADGQGVLGLQRAFQSTGARTVMASLWRVNDAATSVLMEEFYANLWQRKMPKLEALQKAQLFVLRNPQRVQERAKELEAELKKAGVTRAPEDDAAPRPQAGPGAGRSHPVLWAAFVPYGDTGEDKPRDK
jgi:CHAT domain-containing protein/tetratricopeptide (TPR) repeat protein